MRLSVRSAIGLLCALAVGLTFLPARRGDAEATAPVAPPAGARAVRVGLVFDVGGRGDKSFNDGAYEGLMRAKRELGAEVAYLEPTGSEDREAAMRLFAARGFDLVVGVGNIFSSDVTAVARAYPRVAFACVDYGPPEGGPPSNAVGLVFREEQGSFLVGAVAGLVTRTKHVGFVGGMEIPLIHKFEAGYRAGVKTVCPECTVHAAYAGTTPEAFKDPAKGKALAISQIAARADVLYHASGSTGHGVFEAAHDAHAMAIGVDADQHDEMPDAVITSMIKRVDVALLETVRDVAFGRFRGGMRVFGLDDNAVDYVKEGPHAARIPLEVKARVAALRADVVAGRISVPTE